MTLLPHSLLGHRSDAARAKERQRRILTEGASSFSESITDAVVAKDRNLSFLTEKGGQVPLLEGHGLGLYHRDCRYLSGYEFRTGGKFPISLGEECDDGYKTVFQLGNPEIQSRGGSVIEKETVGISWERVLEGRQLRLNETFTIQNYSPNAIEIPLEFRFRCQFEDIFSIRRAWGEDLGHLYRPRWKDNTLFFLYEGKDKIFRSAAIRFSGCPRREDASTIEYDVKLKGREVKKIFLEFSIRESKLREQVQPNRLGPSPRPASAGVAKVKYPAFTVKSSSPLLDRMISRSLGDLRMLESELAGQQYLAAGLPWFMTLFGRDTLISSFFALGAANRNAKDTLRVLAQFQGRQTDKFKEEEPGKILHELRQGELAELHLIPQTPYYGTVDATPLFILLVARHAAWTGECDTFLELRPAVESALDWITKYGDRDGDGYVEYRAHSAQGLSNQGWKDSGDAITHSNGDLAEPPIALVEVQGYVYAAKIEIADLFERTGDPARASQLRQEARRLKEAFNRDFWMVEKKTYALALEKSKRQVDAVSSNPGHALWTGIAEPEKARLTMESLLGEDMFSGWGIRTLSDKEIRYNPMGYHLGSVWPHDNAICAAGLRRYGFFAGAEKIFDGIFAACQSFPYCRLPELFSGFGSDKYSVPIRYPVACHPQAWAAASSVYFVTQMLGLEPLGFERKLRIRHPILPAKVEFLELHQLQVAQAVLSLRFTRGKAGIEVSVLHQEGELEVIYET